MRVLLESALRWNAQIESLQRERRVQRESVLRESKGLQRLWDQSSTRAILRVQEQRARVQQRVQHTCSMPGQAAQGAVVAALWEAVTTTHHGIQPRKHSGTRPESVTKKEQSA